MRNRFIALFQVSFHSKPYLLKLFADYRYKECDRSFTRSDALAKHMRTVHETEALRPSDPVPKNHLSGSFKPQRLKLIVNSKPPQNDSRGPDSGDGLIDDDATIGATSDINPDPFPPVPFEYPPDIHFADEELSMGPDELFKLLRRQVHWAQQEGSELRSEVEALEKKRKEMWQAKELVLANLMEAEMSNAVLWGFDRDKVVAMKDDLPDLMLPMSGKTPWYRHDNPYEEIEREAALRDGGQSRRREIYKMEKAAGNLEKVSVTK